MIFGMRHIIMKSYESKPTSKNVLIIPSKLAIV